MLLVIDQFYEIIQEVIKAHNQKAIYQSLNNKETLLIMLCTLKSLNTAC